MNKSEIIIDAVSYLGFGKQNARLSDYIARDIGIEDNKTNQKLRNIYKEAVLEGYLIGSCKDGYYRIATRAELDETVEDLDHRIAGTRNRRNALIQSWIKKHGEEAKQRSLFNDSKTKV